MTLYKNYEIDCGTTEYEGKKLRICEPYLDGIQGKELYYTAYAYEVDDADKEKRYRLRWEIINSDTEDEGNACEWDDFSIEKIF